MYFRNTIAAFILKPVNICTQARQSLIFKKKGVCCNDDKKLLNIEK